MGELQVGRAQGRARRDSSDGSATRQPETIVPDFRALAEECLQLKQVGSLRPQPLHDGSGWCVEITWSDGSIETVGTFGAESTARDWIEWDAPRFLRKRSARDAVATGQGTAAAPRHE
jgi:hypothetical protein